jgi:integrase
MSLRKRGNIWWYEFWFAGKRIQESAKTTRRTVAAEAERGRRLELEKTLAGMPVEKRQNRILSVSDVVKVYLGHYGINHREQSVLFANGRLAHVKRLLANTLLPDLTEKAIRGYIKTRLDEGAAGRTINMEVGELSRAVGQPWSVLWPRVRKLEERRDVGRALSAEEERRLLNTVDGMRSPLIGTFIRIALLTGMRAGEIVSLTWRQVDLSARVVTVGRAKTSSGTGRQIPMNPELFDVLSAHAAWFTKRFETTDPEHYLFPFGKPMPQDPTKHITDITSAWDALRGASGIRCRLHDLRHTAATKLAEAGVPESTMLALMGHMSRAMLERYSHIRMAAKRDAVQSLSLPRTGAGMELKKGTEKNGVPTKVPTMPTSGLIQ